MSLELLSFVEWLQALIDTFVSRATKILGWVFYLGMHKGQSNQLDDCGH